MRNAGALRRSSYATLAVGATTLALIALLGVSVAIARLGGNGRDGRQEVAGLASADRPAGSGDTRGGGAGAAGASSAGNGSGAPNRRGVLGSNAGGAAAGGAAGSAATATDPGSPATDAGSPSAGTAPGSVSGSGSAGSGSGGSGTASAGSGHGTAAGNPDDATTMSVRTAKAGDWVLRVESHASGALLGEDTGESRLSVGEAASDGTQRFDAHDGPGLGIFGAYTARVVGQGRYLTEVQLRGEPGRRFVAAVPVLDVPSTWRPGDRWTWRLTAADGGTTIDATSSVVGRETITLADGRTEVETVRVDSTFVLGGDRSITVTRKLWFSPSLGVPVRTEEHSTGTDPSGRTVARDATIQLAATEPGSASPVVPSP